MKILWISSLAWREHGNYRFDLKEAGAVSGSLFEQEMIEGIESFGHKVDILNAYPYGDNLIHDSFSWSHNSTASDFCISKKKNKYINIINETCELKQVLRRRSIDYDCVVVYLIHLPFLLALKDLKKRCKIKSALIVPDLPDMMDLGIKKHSLKGVLKKIEFWFLKNAYSYVDKYVLFSKYMRERLPVKPKQSIVIEGINSITTFCEYSKRQEPFTVLYAGSLQYNFGIEQIIDSFSFIKDMSLRLHIYGSGPLQKYVVDKAKEDNRICYCGFVDHETVVKKEGEASLLINARDPLKTYTRYSFPGKTFEYLMSGTPFLSTRLAGVPDEYYNYIIPLDSSMPKDIAESIIKIKNCNEQTIKQRVENGESFLLKEKNKFVQAEKLLSFLGCDDEQ